ncbi:MAG: C40 family peptidase [Peptococcaceae bacterium]|nr:C40 family peptidase [Peptococcaceae bacterium]
MKKAFLFRAVFFICLATAAVPAPSLASQLSARPAALEGMIVPAVGAVIDQQQVSDNTAAAVSRSGSMSDERQILNTAISLLGSSYRYGAEGPKRFDCSGFTRYVFGSAGIDLPHSAAGQLACGSPVDKQDLQPGDLVFFSYYGESGISHVGIYTGNGEFIHASSAKKGVVISSMETPYYLNNYKGACRVAR